MKKSILSIAIAGVITVGLSISAFASDSPSEVSTNNNAKTKITCIEKFMNEGKTFEEAKEATLNQKFTNIDNAVTEGRLTTEAAAEKKENIQERFASFDSLEKFQEFRGENKLNKKENCDGTFKGKGKNGNSKKGMGKQSKDCMLNSNSESTN